MKGSPKVGKHAHRSDSEDGHAFGLPDRPLFLSQKILKFSKLTLMSSITSLTSTNTVSP